MEGLELDFKTFVYTQIYVKINRIQPLLKGPIDHVGFQTHDKDQEQSVLSDERLTLRFNPPNANTEALSHRKVKAGRSTFQFRYSSHQLSNPSTAALMADTFTPILSTAATAFTPITTFTQNLKPRQNLCNDVVYAQQFQTQGLVSHSNGSGWGLPAHTVLPQSAAHRPH